MKAYCVFENFSNEAREIIRNAGIELVVNDCKERPNRKELIDLLKEYDILIIGVFSKVTVNMLEYIKTPKVIATLSVGLDHIDNEIFESHLVKVVNIRLANAISVAEHIFALILALNKRIFESNQLVLDGNGHRNKVSERPDDISSKILGLIGAGSITSEVIKIANAFNMKIKCYTNNPDKHKELLEKGVEFVLLDEVLKESDIINVSIPLTIETKNLISKEKIGLIKKTATFINTSRTEIVDTRALIEYADLNNNFYVGLDVDVENEYKELLSKYRKNVIVTPHTAGISKQAISRMDLELANKVVETSKNIEGIK